MRISFCAVLFAAALNIMPATGWAQGSFTLDQVFSKLDDASKSFRSVEANVEQTDYTAIVQVTDKKSGKMFYAKRGGQPRLKLEFNKPQEEFVLVDNGKAQIYTPKIKQVQEASTVGHQDLVQMFLALGFGQTSDDLKKSFDVTVGPDEVVDGKKTVVLDMKPKNSGTFKAIRMWLEPNPNGWHAVQIKTTEKTDDTHTIKYSNIKINTSIPDSRFKLDLPKDVKIIRL